MELRGETVKMENLIAVKGEDTLKRIGARPFWEVRCKIFSYSYYFPPSFIFIYIFPCLMVISPLFLSLIDVFFSLHIFFLILFLILTFWGVFLGRGLSFSWLIKPTMDSHESVLLS